MYYMLFFPARKYLQTAVMQLQKSVKQMQRRSRYIVKIAGINLLKYHVVLHPTKFKKKPDFYPVHSVSVLMLTARAC